MSSGFMISSAKVSERVFSFRLTACKKRSTAKGMPKRMWKMEMFSLTAVELVEMMPCSDIARDIQNKMTSHVEATIAV